MKTTGSGILAVLLATTACLLAGCSVEVERPDKLPTTAELKDWRLAEIEKVEKAIEKQDYRLPGRVKGLTRRLSGLEGNMTIGPGKNLEGSAETAEAIDRVVGKLRDWHDRSLGRLEDSDADRAELQVILDEAKDVITRIKTST